MAQNKKNHLRKCKWLILFVAKGGIEPPTSGL
jgi:hypothetical protein